MIIRTRIRNYTLSMHGGNFGFTLGYGSATVDDIVIKSYNTSTSAFDITEAEEHFTVDSTTGYASDDLVYDNNGNLTYDVTVRRTTL